MKTLQEVYQHTLALVDPCLAMQERGIPIDDAVRQAGRDQLQDELALLEAGVLAIVRPLLEKEVERYQVALEKVNRKTQPARILRRYADFHLFEQQWTCPCCRGGKLKAQHCWGCAGFERSPGTKIRETLEPCKECHGQGRGTTVRINLDSPAQLKAILFTVLKLPKQKNVDEEALRRLLPKDRWGVVDKLLQMRKHTTIMRIYERMEPATDERLRTSYNPAGTETGRFTSRETFLEEHSTNLQNLPKRQAARNPLYDVRRCVVPQPGWKLIEADLSQAEARIVAALCGDEELLHRWDNPAFDVHRWTAAVAFDKDERSVSKMERNMVGKTVRHAGNYGMSWRRYMYTVNKEADVTGYVIDAETAQRAMERYREVSPLEAWWEQVATQLAKDGCLTTPLGRRRHFFGRRGTDPWLDPVHKEAIAFVPQSTVADLLNMGLLTWWSRYDRPEARLVMQVHDAIVVECHDTEVQEVAEQMRRCLEIPLEVNGMEVTIPADVSVSQGSWARMGEI